MALAEAHSSCPDECEKDVKNDQPGKVAACKAPCIAFGDAAAECNKYCNWTYYVLGDAATKAYYSCMAACLTAKGVVAGVTWFYKK